MRAMDDTPERRAVIDQMRAVAVEDCPWVYLYHRQSLNLVQRWYRNVKPHPVANDVYKYRRVDVLERERTRLAWNRPNYWPAIFLGLFLVVGQLPAVVTVRRRRSARGRRAADAALPAPPHPDGRPDPDRDLPDHLHHLLRGRLAAASWRGAT